MNSTVSTGETEVEGEDRECERGDHGWFDSTVGAGEVGDHGWRDGPSDQVTS
jgi:hypothetical protein